MSRWATTAIVGWDPHLGGTGAPVVAYRHSGHYPPSDEAPASVDTAWMPHWCVPGHAEGDAPADATGPWLRLTVATWLRAESPDGSPSASTTALLSPAAARLLGETLLAWADGPHVAPRP